jgi:hypothetical protein
VIGKLHRQRPRPTWIQPTLVRPRPKKREADRAGTDGRKEVATPHGVTPTAARVAILVCRSINCLLFLLLLAKPGRVPAETQAFVDSGKTRKKRHLALLSPGELGYIIARFAVIRVQALTNTNHLGALT